ncbi:glycosyltransferase [Actinokineospora bangkokensis]|uniref:Glycosyl transferase n=1 Tax=Actinokineospora bangkokensis TaxID=1193682 RepID=A0A1Q9LJM7_9PSEU|nr:nucleotide disphospho-sugar-binding domain-containing protein [Actinokineospora bangkokensis]OLR92205.1 glycosyl transferase [Actinokineospora bangkokensis]
MSRFLLVVPPLVGHINPLAAVAAELTARGHEVAWAGTPELVGRLAGDGARVFGCVVPGTGLHRPPDLTGPAAFQFLWRDFFVPLAEAMAPGVAAAIRAFGPDLVVSDQHAVAGGLVAERLGVPWFTSSTTSAELANPLDEFPKVAQWLTGLLGGLRARIGDPAATHDPRYSPHGVLGFTTRDLIGAKELPSARVHLVGPAIGQRPPDPAFDWPEFDRPTVLVSLGTANADTGTRFLTEAVAAFAARPHLRAVVVDPGGCLAGAEPPPTVAVRAHVPQLELLPRVAAVVCHAGHNTVCESLWNGKPLVLAPIRDDQPIVAGQVVDAGAGVRLRFGRATARHIGAAVDAVLDPGGGHLAAAEAISRSFRAAGGVPAAADHLESALLTAVAE